VSPAVLFVIAVAVAVAIAVYYSVTQRGNQKNDTDIESSQFSLIISQDYYLRIVLLHSPSFWPLCPFLLPLSVCCFSSRAHLKDLGLKKGNNSS